MPKVELPDGTAEWFPDDMPLQEIEAVLQKRFPPEVQELKCEHPKKLPPGKRVRCANAKVIFNEEFGRYAVYDTLDAAIDFADTIQPPPEPRVKQQPWRPEAPVDPAQAAQLIRADVERSIRRHESRERSERLAERRRSRYRNRGTLG
jgi:hypothetical protein